MLKKIREFFKEINNELDAFIKETFSVFVQTTVPTILTLRYVEIYQSSSEISEPLVGDFYLNSVDSKYYIYQGDGVWVASEPLNNHIVEYQDYIQREYGARYNEILDFIDYSVENLSNIKEA